MPLAPPVTTTTLPVTCMRRLLLLCRFWSCSAQHEVENRGIMARRAGQDKAVPDRILEAQTAPGVEYDAKGVERPTRHHKPQRHHGKSLDHGVIEHHPAPANHEINADGDTVEPPRVAKLQHDADDRDAPDADEQREREHAVL